MSAAWRDIPECPGYQASDDGRIRSVDRVIIDSLGRRRRLKGRAIAVFPDSEGYFKAGIGRKVQLVHRLICMAFHGSPPFEGAHAAHRDGDNQNNAPENLYWATPTENIHDVIRHGRNHNANKTHCLRGHEFTVENTIVSPQGARRCRECARARHRNYKERHPDRAKASALAYYYRQRSSA